MHVHQGSASRCVHQTSSKNTIQCSSWQANGLVILTIMFNHEGVREQCWFSHVIVRRKMIVGIAHRSNHSAPVIESMTHTQNKSIVMHNVTSLHTMSRYHVQCHIVIHNVTLTLPLPQMTVVTHCVHNIAINVRMQMNVHCGICNSNDTQFFTV